MVVVNRFSKMTYFVHCDKTYGAAKIVDFYIWEIVQLLDIPNIFTSDRDSKFIGHFRRNFWAKLDTNLQLDLLIIIEQMDKLK